MALTALLEPLHTGPVTAGNAPYIDLRGYDLLVIRLEGTYVGAVKFQGAVVDELEEAHWFPVALRPVDGTGPATDTVDHAGDNRARAYALPIDLGPLSGFRLRFDADGGEMDAWARKEGSG